MQKSETNKRVFFALWPDDVVRLKLVKAFEKSDFSKFSGKNSQANNLHLTLHFLGNISSEKFHCVMNGAEQFEFNSFELRLNKFSVFQKANIFYMGMTHVPNELMELQTELGERLSACDFQSESQVFMPHVTLKRKINQFDVNDESPEIFWQVKQFALVESVAAEGRVMYKPLKFFNCAL